MASHASDNYKLLNRQQRRDNLTNQIHTLAKESSNGVYLGIHSANGNRWSKGVYLGSPMAKAIVVARGGVYHCWPQLRPYLSIWCRHCARQTVLA